MTIVLALPSQQFTIANLALDALGAVVTIGGTVLCYRANKRGHNSDFIGRMICLTWPIGIKVTVLLVIVGIVAAVPFVIIMWKMQGSVGDQGWEIFGTIVGLGTEIC